MVTDVASYPAAILCISKTMLPRPELDKEVYPSSQVGA